MKKVNILFVILISLVFIPINVYADTIDLTKYNAKNLEEVFSEEGISYDFSNYTETDDKVTIYLFRGKGCTYCRKFLNYVQDTLLDKYGDKFKIVSYEVWYDSNNSELMSKVAEFMGDNASGVPYIVIGDQSFIGYSSSYDSKIENAILKLYNSKDKYDVLTSLVNGDESKANSNSKSSMTDNADVIIIWNTIISAVGVGLIIYYNYSVKQKLEREIQELKDIIKKEKARD